MIVISSDAYNRSSTDIVVVAMTSNPAPVAHSFVISSKDLSAGALNRPGTVRVDKIYTLAGSLVAKRIAKVTHAIVAKIRATFDTLTAP